MYQATCRTNGRNSGGPPAVPLYSKGFALLPSTQDNSVMLFLPCAKGRMQQRRGGTSFQTRGAPKTTLLFSLLLSSHTILSALLRHLNGILCIDLLPLSNDDTAKKLQYHRRPCIDGIGSMSPADRTCLFILVPLSRERIDNSRTPFLDGHIDNAQTKSFRSSNTKNATRGRCSSRCEQQDNDKLSHGVGRLATQENFEFGGSSETAKARQRAFQKAI